MKNMSLRFWIVFTASIILAAVFLSAGIGRLLGDSAFLLTMKAGMPTGMQTFVIEWLPWIEIVLGAALLLGIASQLTSLVSCVLSAVFMFQNIWSLSQGLGYKP